MDAVTVIGAGGIGCALGYALRSAGVEVEFVDSDAGKVEFGRQFGVQVEGKPPQDADFTHFQDWKPTNHRVHLLCTKCYDNAAVLSRLPSDAILVPIQNGFDHQLESRGHAVEGIASFVSECEAGQTKTRLTRHGRLHIGYRNGDRVPWLSKLVHALRQARLFPVVEVATILPTKNAKLMYNAAISPLAAASGIDNGQLLQLPLARRLFFEFLRENYNILTHSKKPLGKVGPFHPDTVMKILRQPWLSRLLARAFTPGLRGTYCSMSGDITKGRTEVSNYNGQLIAWANGTPCPLNRRALEIVEGMSANREKPGLEALHRFE